MGYLYARFPPKLLFKMDNGEMETVLSRTGIQQGCNLGPLCFSAGGLPLLQKFRANPPVKGAQAFAYIDDVMVTLPPERASDMKAVSDVTVWLQRELGDCGITLNRHKSKILLPSNVRHPDLPASERVILDETRLSVAQAGMCVVGVPVGPMNTSREKRLTRFEEKPSS